MPGTMSATTEDQEWLALPGGVWRGWQDKGADQPPTIMKVPMEAVGIVDA